MVVEDVDVDCDGMGFVRRTFLPLLPSLVLLLLVVGFFPLRCTIVSSAVLVVRLVSVDWHF